MQRDAKKTRDQKEATIPAVPHGPASHLGFTLIEMLMVMAVITMLAGMVVGVGVYARGAALRARARSDIQKIHTALNEYRMNYRPEWPADDADNTYPYPSVSGVNATELGDTHLVDMFEEGDTEFIDPWGAPYVYDYDANSAAYSYRLFSAGPDGAPNTGDDISSGR